LAAIFLNHLASSNEEMKKSHEEFGKTNSISLDELKYSTVQLAYKSKDTTDAKTREVTKYFYARVPRFLVNAFTFLHARKYLDTEGIFRKQGNSSKIKGSVTEYFQGNKIDDDLSVFDVCVLIKRFITSIKGGLFGDKEDKIVDSAFDQNGKATPITLCHFCHTLPEHSFGVLAYLVFQMARIIRHSQNNKMNAENLATILVPGMFQSFNRGITKNDIHGIKRHQETLQQTVVMIITHESALFTPRMMLRNNSINRQQFPLPIMSPLKEKVTPNSTPKATPRALPKRSASVSNSKKPAIVAPTYSHAAAIHRSRSNAGGQSSVRSQSRSKWQIFETIGQKLRSKRSSYSFTNVNPDLKTAYK